MNRRPKSRVSDDTVTERGVKVDIQEVFEDGNINTIDNNLTAVPNIIDLRKPKEEPTNDYSNKAADEKTVIN